MLARPARRREQKKYDIDGNFIDGLEIDRFPQNGQNGKWRAKALNSSMRDGHAAPDARRSQFLSACKRGTNNPLIQCQPRGGMGRESLDEFGFRGDRQVKDDILWQDNG
jgi:hypothetical protein